MPLEMNNPSPVPLSDLVANFVNSLGRISGCMPTPVSLILIMTSSISLFMLDIMSGTD